jgi:hypothetical protein
MIEWAEQNWLWIATLAHGYICNITYNKPLAVTIRSGASFLLSLANVDIEGRRFLNFSEPHGDWSKYPLNVP